jgi:hypothetical protein
MAPYMFHRSAVYIIPLHSVGVLASNITDCHAVGVCDLAHVEYQVSGEDRRETEGCGGENEAIRYHGHGTRALANQAKLPAKKGFPWVSQLTYD